MHRQLLVVAAAVCAALTAASCGGGSSDGAGGGGLGFRALWQRRAAVGEVSVAGTGEGMGAFGPALPAAVITIRVLFTSGARRCCVAVDPDHIRDPVTGEGALILTGLEVFF